MTDCLVNIVAYICTKMPGSAILIVRVKIVVASYRTMYQIWSTSFYQNVAFTISGTVCNNLAVYAVASVIVARDHVKSLVVGIVHSNVHYFMSLHIRTYLLLVVVPV